MNTRRLLLSPLALLVALASIVGLNVSPATAAIGPETRVRAIEHAATLTVGLEAPETPGMVGFLEPPQPQMAVGSRVATNTVGNIARVVSGGGGSIDNIAAGDALRIQNAADRIGRPITVVGSRADGTASAWSDWDYVISDINSGTRHSVSSSLPTGHAGLGQPRALDIFAGPLNTDLPHVTFYPAAPG